MQSTASATPPHRNLWYVLAAVALLILALVVFTRPWTSDVPPRASGERPESTVTARDTTTPFPEASLSEPESSLIPPVSHVKPSSKSTKGIARAAPPRSPEVAFVPGSVDSWQDWNSSFSDTVTRTYSAIFDTARLDTVSGQRLVFSASGKKENRLLVKRVFCQIDSVWETVKYTFPGQSVSVGIGVVFAVSVSLKGELHPQATSCTLELFTPEYPNEARTGSPARNQFIVVLNSPPGYAYALRTGIECLLDDASGGSIIYYTPRTVVEFRRIIKYQSLLSDTADSILVLTSNLRAVMDLSRLLPHTVVSAVFVPVEDPSEIEGLRADEFPNVRIHVSQPRILDRSFIILNETEALVEDNILDPDFKHIAQLKMGERQLHRLGHPRLTRHIRDKGTVDRLKLRFALYGRLRP